GAKNAMIHFYIATSELHRQFVIGGTEDEQIEIARDATQQIKDGVSDFPDKVRLEFSPEEFTDSDLDYVVKVCDTVVETWGPEGDEKVVLNLPATVERRFPNEYADMIEEFMKRQKFSDQTIVSLHAHNDMGMGIASTMLSLKAGAQRVEGTLFGHGERTGNVDLIICALDLDYLGIDTGLSFDNLPQIANLVEEVTDIKIHPRHPYSGELVFTAFSGSHQDAINKGYNQKEELAEHFKGWKIPYLHIDPLSLGRSFEKFIRINSQSGKGGIAYILSQEFHINLPRWAQVDFASKVQVFADEVQRELAAEELFTLFKKAYMQDDAPILLQNYWPVPSQEDPAIILGRVKVEYKGEDHELNAEGNGPISAFVHAIKQLEGVDDFVLEDFSEGTRGKTADAEAVSFVRLKHTDGKHSFIGAGIGSNIDQAAVRAVCNALNALLKF
ncbi:MAG: 2-isopropylmalate synthase, partial [Lentisphaeria bacterium]|nr:2-isopropylmalate synthase [Lentisphaeria bacterium]NQZ67927.1 2-isopropylmalate synthase [Lentisphaeria bacterium]